MTTVVAWPLDSARQARERDRPSLVRPFRGPWAPDALVAAPIPRLLRSSYPSWAVAHSRLLWILHILRGATQDLKRAFLPCPDYVRLFHFAINKDFKVRCMVSMLCAVGN